MLKRKRINLEQAHRAIAVYEKIPIKFVDVELNESLEIAEALNIYAYDAYLIRCALKHQCPLISLDQALVAHARQRNVQVMEVFP